MEEILASIRRIIAEDGEPAGQGASAAPPPSVAAAEPPRGGSVAVAPLPSSAHDRMDEILEKLYREGRSALVPDPDELQVTSLLRPAQRVGEAQVGVADHPEDPGDAVRDQGLDQDVGDRSDRLRAIGQ